MPRGSGHPDLSQRPRREAPGMLTGLAILERELGMNDYERHKLARKLEGRLTRAEATAAKREIEALEQRRKETLRLLDELHQDYDERITRAMKREL